MGRCKFPIYFTRKKAEAWLDMWGIINETRMLRNSWSFLGSNLDSLPPAAQLFRTMAEQNQYRLRARYLRTLPSGGNSADMDDVPDAQERGDDDWIKNGLLRIQQPNYASHRKLLLPYRAPIRNGP